MPVIHIHSKAEFDAALKKTSFKATVVDFTATWCGPCQMIKPYFEAQSNEFRNVQFLKVDVDELSDVAGEAGVRAMPTFQIYKERKKVEEIVGASKDKLEVLVKKYNEQATAALAKDAKKDKNKSKGKKCTIL